ncbi:O-antigen ligase family protein [Candidatus Parcubacteria bacterium]|nr:O-antigen ligase family protein [Candidatus Parcubacteria bacterium]
MIQSYILRIIQGGLVLALFTPLVILRITPFPFIVGKAVFFQSLIGVLLILWLILLILDYPEKRFLPSLNSITLTVFLFFAVLGIATVFSVDSYHSFWGNMERMEGFFSFFHLLVFFIIIISVFKTKIEWLWFLRFALISAAFVSIYSIGQKFGFLGLKHIQEYIDYGLTPIRVPGPIGNSALLAGYLIFPLFLSIFLFFWTSSQEKLSRSDLDTSILKNHYWCLSYFFCFLLIGYTLILTGGRSAFLGVIFGVLIFIGIYSFFSGNEKFRKWSKIAILIFLLIFFSFLGFLYLNKDQPWLKEKPLLARFSNMTQGSSFQSRLQSWQIGFQGFKEKPILGWGTENYSIVFSKFYNPKILSYSNEWFDRPHNKTLETMVNTGILGLLAYLSIFGAVLFKLFKKIKDNKDNKVIVLSCSCLIGLLFAYFFQNQLMLDTLSSYIMFFATLGVVYHITSTYE